MSCTTFRGMSRLSIRFDERLLERLENRVDRSHGGTTSGLVQRLVEEGLRQAEHPGIVFRDGPAGRRAALMSGPDVWEVIQTIQEVDERGDDAIEACADLLDLDIAQIRRAIDYYARWPREIDALVDGNQQAVEAAYASWLVEPRMST